MIFRINKIEKSKWLNEFILLAHICWKFAPFFFFFFHFHILNLVDEINLILKMNLGAKFIFLSFLKIFY